ncbi:hypothetical protein CMO92_03525 [Candidatus Woesearchaeota archaeon]|nr:hypothetical protein [Candidatus Woesearchaeota archaeon]|tara:strand:+ start:92 stop:487 length:396 start_codon:yes stop_codon:yes gene_type:complete
MKKTLLQTSAFLILFFLVGCLTQQSIPEEKGCENWFYSFGEQNSYTTTYNVLPEGEQRFTGTFLTNTCMGGTGKRCLPYTLDGIPIFTGPQDHSQFEGKKVEIMGKRRRADVEGTEMIEIWPIMLRCAPEE